VSEEHHEWPWALEMEDVCETCGGEEVTLGWTSVAGWASRDPQRLVPVPCPDCQEEDE
jgi:hypothetical protein